MKLYISMVLLACVLLTASCQQQSSTAKDGSYYNSATFDPQTMAVVMIDQGVFVKTVDGKKYNSSISVWEAKNALQENLIINAGNHTLGVQAEKLFHHIYGSKIIEINFTAEPDKIYRIMKSVNDGQKIIGIYEKKHLVAEAARK